MSLPFQFLPLDKQMAVLIEILKTNTELIEVLRRGRCLGAPNWYIGAGAVAQTVWNHFHQFPQSTGVKDYDLIYFDSDLNIETEQKFIEAGVNLFQGIERPVEVTNQARVHLWYEQEFGSFAAQLTCSEEGITTWPNTATALGVRLNSDDSFTVYAPFGLHDLLGLIVRPNKVKITEQVYLDKTNRWRAVWPKLTIMPW